MTHKESRNLIAEYERNGFRVEKGGRHWKVFDGPRLVTVFSNSKCNGRADQNSKATLRRLVRQRQTVTA